MLKARQHAVSILQNRKPGAWGDGWWDGGPAAQARGTLFGFPAPGKIWVWQHASVNPVLWGQKAEEGKSLELTG